MKAPLSVSSSAVLAMATIAILRLLSALLCPVRDERADAAAGVRVEGVPRDDKLIRAA